MISMKEFMDAVNYRITEGSEFCWQCYGPKAHTLDSWNGDHTGHSASICFDRDTQVVYEVSVSDYARNRAYRIINPDFRAAYDAEANTRSVNPNEAWDNVDYIDLDVEDDFMEKLTAILNGEEYDTRVQIELTLDDDSVFLLMKMAHEADLTLNDFVGKLLREELDRIHVSAAPQSDKMIEPMWFGG